MDDDFIHGHNSRGARGGRGQGRRSNSDHRRAKQKGISELHHHGSNNNSDQGRNAGSSRGSCYNHQVRHNWRSGRGYDNGYDGQGRHGGVSKRGFGNDFDGQRRHDGGSRRGFGNDFDGQGRHDEASRIGFGNDFDGQSRHDGTYRRGFGNDFDGQGKHKGASRRGFGNDIGSTSSGPQNKRHYPTGLRTLEEWFNQPPDMIVLSINGERSGFNELLKDKEIKREKLFLLMRVLAKATYCHSAKEGLLKIYSTVFVQDFVNNLVRFHIGLTMYRQIDKASFKTFFEDQLCLLKAYAQAMPLDAADSLPVLIKTVKLVLATIYKDEPDVFQSFYSNYDNIHKTFDEYLRCKEEKERENKKMTYKDRLALLDFREPEESFRDLPVEPTDQDIQMKRNHSLRRNLTDRAFTNVNTYLDIQFRLLREDFIHPLRTGIQAFRANNNTKSHDVRIYKNVYFSGSEIIRGKIVNYITLSLPKRLNLETSRRLMFGNMLCISCDGFVNFFLASVSHRDDVKMKAGIIGISFISDAVKVDHSVSYTVIESRTYYLAYKPVLVALKSLNENNLPFVEHIIEVKRDVQPPSYLLDRRHHYYDLRVILDFSLMKQQDDDSVLFPPAPGRPPGDTDAPELRCVNVLNEVRLWPSHKVFGLDQSQFSALHSALTRRFVIIQGPPGTGKTFLGLKITQALLHNSEHWSEKQQAVREIGGPEEEQQIQQPPILVVCYTNHALDQFLEDMLKFTRKIVRIGGRSKSEEIREYQINKLVNNLRRQKKIPANIHHANIELENNLVTAASDFTALQNHVKKVTGHDGILKLSLLHSKGAIPVEHYRNFANEGVYRNWLLGDHSFTHTLPSKEVWEKVPNAPVIDENFSVDENDDEFYDALELLREEERDRLFDDEFDDFLDGPNADLPPGAVVSQDAYFSVTMNDYDHIEERFLDRSGHQKVKHANSEAHVKEKDRLKVFLEETQTYKDNSWKLRENVDIHKLAFKDKCRLYCQWKHQLETKLQDELIPYEQTFRQLSARVDEIKRSRYLYVARQAHVIGMTTTGASEYQSLLQDLKPKIVVIEEAAEILEAHVVSALSASCQHLIMIGDHQQLKPSTAVYTLAKDYNLDMSLFERMIKNDLSYQTLKYQHRMRPEISQLLVPTIYDKLLDHPSVERRPHILGMDKSVFFLTHEIHEADESDDNNSHMNEFEAKLTMQLAKHLVLQGYSTDQITVLTPYSGQFFLLRQELKKLNTCTGLRISVVDNFQGEENDIILLSLVRSNQKSNVGFLKVENRVCVALSRAKLGMYIVGNMKQLCHANPHLWEQINKTLESQKAVGDAFPLRCQNHPSTITYVHDANELKYKSPDGGCRQYCSANLPRCSHQCPRVCHIDDPNHEKAKCQQPCEKVCEKWRHRCKTDCWKECPPCNEPVETVLLCKHKHMLPCHQDSSKYLCPTIVEKTMPLCDHTIEMPCHQDPQTFKCPAKCDVKLDCGHACRNKCHKNNDPQHQKYICQEQCANMNKDCSTGNHPCRLKCYEACSKCNVTIKKTPPCGHEVDAECSLDMQNYKCHGKCKRSIAACGHFCKKKCFEPCGDCTQLIEKKIIECGHTVKVECRVTPKKKDCSSKKCSLILPCGHACAKECRSKCTNKCLVTISTSHKCPKGHPISVPCYLSATITAEAAMQYCSAKCSAKLDCEHQCSGTCGKCLQGRLHVPCGQRCTRSLVCGHPCKSPCSAACPPCQNTCQWRCQHSKCNKTCGIQCVPCREPCEPACNHQERCGAKCGDLCKCTPCERPCSKTIKKCGHPCIGFCGDPCPLLCRECDYEELTDFMLSGAEDEEDARFVLLKDCGHVIEYTGLKGWLEQDTNQIQMKTCPKCRCAIYNNRRFKNIILKTYQDVQKVLFKHNEDIPSLETIVNTVTRVPDVAEVDPHRFRANLPGVLNPLLQQRGDAQRFAQNRLGHIVPEGVNLQEENIRQGAEEQEPNRRISEHIMSLLKETCGRDNTIQEYGFVKTINDHLSLMNAPQDAYVRKGPKKQKKLVLSTEKLYLYDFQANLLEKAAKMMEDLASKDHKCHLVKIVRLVMKQDDRIAQQYQREVGQELRRLNFLEIVASVKGRCSTSNNMLQQLLLQITEHLSPVLPMTLEREQKVTPLLKECEKYVGSLGISEKERLDILSAMKDTVQKGAWYKCPNGHIYCITECGGAMVEGVCPECGAAIGGGSHRLRSDNQLASEMDEATRPAWPQGPGGY